MVLPGEVSFFLAFCIAALLILLLWRTPTGKANLPPGPTPLPLVGTFFHINVQNMIGSLLRLQEKYGPVFTVYMGSQPAVVLCGYEAVKEALVDHAEAFSARAPMPALDKKFTDYGVVFTNGERWKQLRRFSLTTLRNFGMGKRSIEERIQEEAGFLVEELKKTEGHPFDPSIHLSHISSNVICSVVFGNRFEYEDKEFITFLDLIKKILVLLFSPWMQLCVLFPRLMKIAPGPHRKLAVYMDELERFVSGRIRMHRESLDPNCPRDFIDCFLTKMEQERENPASEFVEENLTVTVLNLFFAGTESVSTTMRYGLLLLLRYPEIEAKIQAEIDEVVGRNRSPSMEDRTKMPYTDATVQEILRFADFSPLGVPRVATSDTQFRGYTIPKGTAILTFLTTILHDPQRFETPEKFNPGHFLDENGAFKRSEAFIPFSAGKRVCLGEALARMELFLFLTTLLQNFKLGSLQDREEIDISPEIRSGGKLPPPYRLCMVPR
ncbi:PREDICTED: cytochrome P450 2G1-like isoform X1 [Gekko japonicus]|uniref:Cytochrome P450 2G1-like isoform X1 n=1 Tax=Gekko japonicus TaxID=146911 RepID=A0ABM1JM20_GEKJA|nr:PREDICTED: cytochrome P450 2G1-like isoform X1 [Gekko japonicus]